MEQAQLLIPPISAGMGSYTADSHHIRRMVDAEDFVRNEGNPNVISTHATLDTGEGWGIKDARELVGRAARLLQKSNLGRENRVMRIG